jgi:hypothetical protein
MFDDFGSFHFGDAKGEPYPEQPGFCQPAGIVSFAQDRFVWTPQANLEDLIFFCITQLPVQSTFSQDSELMVFAHKLKSDSVKL